MALSANRQIVAMGSLDLRGFEVAAATHLYKDGLVGVHPATGYAKPFEPGDVFVGLADDAADNSSGAAGDNAFTTGKQGTVDVRIAGEFEHTLTGVAQGDVGRAVYATADDTLSFSGHPDGFVGRVVDKVATNKALVRIKAFGQKPLASDTGSVEFVYNGQLVTPTGATAGPTYNLGLIAQSALGLGVLNTATGGLTEQFDATAEIAQASVETPPVLSVTKGITFYGKLHLSDIADSNTMDADWGLGNVLDATTRADMDNATLTKHVRFHMDGASANILAESDDDAADVAAVDTTIDNALGTDKEFLIVVRPTGVAELYIDGVRMLSTTTFGISTSGSFAGFVNMEKTSNDTTAVVLIDKLRIAGSRG